ncbi:hypothetical protein IV87_GL000128 [Pediococcus ethanolidurans]|nr:hypothetical protein IV87_GL000128 [Pediococcus ethanolidurans]
MIGLLLLGIGYPVTGAFAEEDQTDQFRITETKLTNENDEKVEEVDAEKQINAKFHLKMTGKQARENDGTVLQLLGTESLSIKNSTQQITPEVVNGTFIKAPSMTFQYSDEFSTYMLKWDKTDFDDVADDQEFDYEITLPLEIKTITEDFKADIEMKFSGLKDTVKFSSLSFLAPVENEKVESESSTSTEKESETSKEEKQESSESKSESESDEDEDSDTAVISESQSKKASKKVAKSIEEVVLPTLPNRTGNPLGVAANFHIFAENFADGGRAHTSGNIAVNSLTNTSGIGNEERDEHWQETSYVKNYDGTRNEISFRTGVFGDSHSLSRDNNGVGNYLTGGPLGNELVRYHHSNEAGKNPTGAAINGNWIDVTNTLTDLKQTRKELVETPYAIDFEDTRYLTTDGNKLTLNFENEEIQNTFVIRVDNLQIAGKEFDIKLRDDQNLIFIASPDSDGRLGSAHMNIYVDGEAVGSDPEAGSGTRFNYSILWVIPEEFEEFTLVGSMFFGSILAPSQTVTSTTNFNGTIVADTYLGSSAETHSWTYNPTTPVIPEPEDTRLVLRKTIEGTEDNKQEKFKFVITREDIDGFDETLKMLVSGESVDRELKFTNGKSDEITLGHDQFISLVVPNGSAFSIEEVGGPLTSTSITFNNDPGTTIDGKLSGTITMGTKEKGESQIVDYVNSFTEEEPKTKDLQIKKTVSGSVPDGTKFKFDLSIDPAEAGTYKYSIDGGDERTIEFDSEGKSTSSIELTAGQTVTIKDLPETSKVTVNEVDADGYKTDITYNGEKHENQKTIEIELGKITDDSALVVFNNHLTSPTMPVTGGIGNLIIILVGLMVLASGMWLYRKKVR